MGCARRRLWGLKSDKKGRSRAALEALFEGYMELFTVIDHVNYATEDAFPYGADVRILDPSAGRGALDAQQDALEAAAVSSQAPFGGFSSSPHDSHGWFVYLDVYLDLAFSTTMGPVFAVKLKDWQVFSM